MLALGNTLSALLSHPDQLALLRSDRPDEFDITRKKMSMLSFGQGVHSCAGNWLAIASNACRLLWFGWQWVVPRAAPRMAAIAIGAVLGSLVGELQVQLLLG